VSATLSVYPGDPSVVGVACLYSEYRYVSFVARLVPRGTTSSLGTHFLGFRYAAPSGAPISLNAAATLSAFAVSGCSHGVVVSSRLQVAAAARRWYRFVPNASGPVLLDPDVVQAWLVVGADSLQSGVISADVHVRYTIQLRGAVDLPNATTTLDGQFAATLRL